MSKPSLDIKNSGLISLTELKTQLGVIVRIENFDIDATVRVQKFRFTIIRKNEVLEQFENNGAKFSTKIIAKFNILKSDDRILIDNVYVHSHGVKELLQTESSEFIIE